MSLWGKLAGTTALNPEGRRLLGLTLETGEPIFGPKGRSSCTYAPAGSGKSTCVAMPALLSFLASEPEKAVLVSDPKDGELAAQVIPILKRLNRKFGLIDDFAVLPEFADDRITLNSFGASVATLRHSPEDLLYTADMEAHALIEEPSERDRNFCFRESPRQLIQFGQRTMLKRNTALATPGAVSALLSDTEMFVGMAEIDIEEGDPALQALARGALELRDHEHFAQHMGEARRALRQFGPGTRLADAGRDATFTHEDLISDGYVGLLVGPQALMSKLGSYYALHLGAFTQAIYQKIGKLRIIADEYTNSPLKSLTGDAITTVRGFGGEFHLIAQSRSEVVRKYGDRLTETIEDNCIVTQWLGFGFREAERVSKLIGEQHAVASGLSGDSDGLKTQTNLSLIKQPHMSPAELMAMPAGQQLIHIKGVGIFLARTIGRNQIAPYCDLLAPNRLEGGRLPSDPKVTLTTPETLS
ncbi:MAG: type IV secretory system conjugative DNA transfer family protein [Pseudomonadota bacterium]